MKFYDREKELELIKRMLQSKRLSFVIVKGLRRIGKTSLIIEAVKNKKFVNIFVPKDKTSSLFLEEIAEELKIPKFTRMIDFLRYLFEKYEIVFIDEFQNFYSMDKSIYSDIQKLCEEFKNKELCILVTGSSYSLMKKIFSDYAKALYGRKDIELTLEEFNVLTVFEILQDLGIKKIEEKIKFWSVFGGIPKFYDLIEKLRPKSFDDFMKTLYLQVKTIIDEGDSMLINEFGGEYKTYYTILEAISTGKTKLSEIASVFENDPSRTNRYLDIMRKEYNLVIKNTPILEDVTKSRSGIYLIKNNFLSFWFSFLKKYQAYYEQNRHSELYEKFKQQINTFIGVKFEKFCLELIKSKKLFSFDKIGKQWGKLEKRLEKSVYEIDLVGVKEKTGEIWFVECKWQDNANANVILKELKEKARNVNWNNRNRKENYVIFAKSFKEKLENCYDLNDIKSLLL